MQKEITLSPLKYVFVVDSNGFVIDSKFVGENDRLKENEVDKPFPPNIFKPKWNGSEWVETATQEEIEEIINRKPEPLNEIEIVGQLITERELEAMVQGQQITDLELRMLMIEMGANK